MCHACVSCQPLRCSTHKVGNWLIHNNVRKNSCHGYCGLPTLLFCLPGKTHSAGNIGKEQAGTTASAEQDAATAAAAAATTTTTTTATSSATTPAVLGATASWATETTTAAWTSAASATTASATSAAAATPSTVATTTATAAATREDRDSVVQDIHGHCAWPVQVRVQFTGHQCPPSAFHCVICHCCCLVSPVNCHYKWYKCHSDVRIQWHVSTSVHWHDVTSVSQRSEDESGQWQCHQQVSGGVDCSVTCQLILVLVGEVVMCGLCITNTPALTIKIPVSISLTVLKLFHQTLWQQDLSVQQRLTELANDIWQNCLMKLVRTANVVCQNCLMRFSRIVR